MIKFRLKELLTEKDLNQKQLFEITGIRPSTISAYYNNTAKSISLENMNLICTSLNCEIQDFIVHSNNISKLDNLRDLRNKLVNNNSTVDEIDNSLLLKEFSKIFDSYSNNINSILKTTAVLIGSDPELLSNKEDLSNIKKITKLEQKENEAKEYFDIIKSAIEK